VFSFFRKKTSSLFPFHELSTDVHSHIIPGIDDGAGDSEISVKLVNGLIELGYKEFTATPHVMEDIWRNDKKSISAGSECLINALHGAGIQNKVNIAAEYLIDGNFEQLLKDKDPLLCIRDNWVLVEISFIQPPMQLKEVFFEMQLQGYQPVFAHPERYNFYHTQRKALEELHDAGLIFQANLLSFSNYYGPHVRKAAEWMAEQGMIDLLGTDLHHERHLAALQDLKLTKSLAKALESAKEKHLR
jgi:tyrosine-protein phosphatase YwqE